MFVFVVDDIYFVFFGVLDVFFFSNLGYVIYGILRVFFDVK